MVAHLKSNAAAGNVNEFRALRHFRQSTRHCHLESSADGLNWEEQPLEVSTYAYVELLSRKLRLRKLTPKVMFLFTASERSIESATLMANGGVVNPKLLKNTETGTGTEREMFISTCTLRTTF